MNEGDTSKKMGKKSLFKRFTEGNQSTAKHRGIKPTPEIQDRAPPTVTKAAAPPAVIREPPTSIVRGPSLDEPLAGYDVGGDAIEVVSPIRGNLSSQPQIIPDGVDRAVLVNSSDSTSHPGPSAISSTIPNPRKSPNILRVEDAFNDDNSIATLNPVTMELLALFRGDSIVVRGKKRRDTILIVFNDDTVEEGKIFINKVARNNLHIKVGEDCEVQLCSNLQYAERVHIVPFEDSIQGFSGNVFTIYLQPYFLEAYRPVRKGDTFLVKADLRTVEFKVLGVQPAEYGIVAPDTIIHTEGKPVQREDSVGYDNVGGYRTQMARIRELVELPLRHPQIFKSIGSRPPRGLLIYGPPGTGKTLMVRAVANEIGVHFCQINGHEIMSKQPSETEQELRWAFEGAKKNSPAIIFLDAVEVIASRREKTNVYDERRLVSQLLALIDGVSFGSKVFVVAASDRPNSIDPALRRFGRLEHEVEIGIPDFTERLEILLIHARNMKLGYDVDLEQIAADTHGFVGSDLVSLCSEAATQQIRENVDLIDPHETTNDDSVPTTLNVTMENFRCAMGASKPSALRRMLHKMSTAAKRNNTNGGLNNVNIADTPPVRLEEWLESLDIAPARCMSNFRFAYLYDRFEPKGIDTLEVFNELGREELIRDFGLSLGVALKLTKWAKDDLSDV